MISKFSFSYSSRDSVWPPSSLVAQRIKNPPAKKKKESTCNGGGLGSIPGSGKPLEKGCEPHSHAEPRPLPCCDSAVVRGPRVSIASGGEGSILPETRGPLAKIQLMPPADCEGDGEMQFRCL